MNSVVEGLIVTAMGAAWATICTFALRSDWYIQRTAGSVLRSNRRPVTPDAIAQVVPWLKTGLIMCLVMGVAIAVVGVIVLVMGVATVLKGP
jgi:hypothetical protein